MHVYIQVRGYITAKDGKPRPQKELENALCEAVRAILSNADRMGMLAQSLPPDLEIGSFSVFELEK